MKIKRSRAPFSKSRGYWTFSTFLGHFFHCVRFLFHQWLVLSEHTKRHPLALLFNCYMLRSSSILCYFCYYYRFFSGLLLHIFSFQFFFFNSFDIFLCCYLRKKDFLSNTKKKLLKNSDDYSKNTGFFFFYTFFHVFRNRFFSLFLLFGFQCKKKIYWKIIISLWLLQNWFFIECIKWAELFRMHFINKNSRQTIMVMQ